MKKSSFAAGIAALTIAASMLNIYGTIPVYAQSPSTQITVEEARKLAIDHAGVEESSVIYKASDHEAGDGTRELEIDFYSGNTEFGYEIDAETGTIIEAKSELMDAEDYAEVKILKARENAVAESTDGMATGTVNDKTALEIAMKDAGVSKHSISSCSIFKVSDDDLGIMTYEVEFRVGNSDYSYEINPNTGEILAVSVDYC